MLGKILALILATNSINPTNAQLRVLPTVVPSQAVLPAQTLQASRIVVSQPSQPIASVTTWPLQTGQAFAATLPSTQTFVSEIISMTAGSMSQQELQEYVNFCNQYVTEAMVLMHSNWHAINGQAEFGPGSGTAFILMHRAMLQRFEAQRGRGKTPPLSPSELLPSMLAAVGEQFSVSTIDPIPGYFSDIGGYLPPDASLYITLNDIRTPDQLGRLLGNIHSAWHRQLGPTMMSIGNSVRAPIFWNLHATIDAIVNRWEASTAGQDFRLANPRHALFQPLEAPTAYTNQRFVNDNNGCGGFSASQDPLCAQIARIDQIRIANRATIGGGPAVMSGASTMNPAAFINAEPAMNRRVIMDRAPAMGRGSMEQDWRPRGRPFARPGRQGPRGRR